MSHFAVLTYDLRVFCEEQGELIARPLETLSDLSSVAVLAPYHAGWNLRTSGEHEWWYDFETGWFNRSMPEGNIIVEGDPSENGICRLIGLDSYFHVRDTGRVEPNGALRHRRESVVRLLSLEDVRAFWEVLQQRWLLGPDRSLATICGWESNVWEIHLAHLMIEFDVFLNAVRQRAETGQRDLLLRTDRHLYRAVPYRPVVTYRISCPEQLLELSVALRSLVENGQYQGDVYIASELPEQRVRAFVPRHIDDKTTIVPIRQRGRRDEQGGFIPLLASGVFDRFAPVLCLTSTVMVTRPIGRFLRRLALGNGLGGRVNRVFTEEDPSLEEERYGAFLYRDDEIATTPYYGFSVSILAIPSPSMQREFFRETFRCSVAYLQDRSRPLQGFHEEGVLNYVARKLNAFDPNLLHRGDIGSGDDAQIGKIHSTLLDCSDWLQDHRAALMRSHLDSLPRETA